MTPLWQLFVSGAAGSLLTYALTWWRENKRMQDAYRAPQRQAIGDILAAGHELQLRILNWRLMMTHLIEEIGQDRTNDLPTFSADIRETQTAYAEALLEMRRAFEVGSLTVVDVKCWQEMIVAAAAFTRFDDGEIGVISSVAEAEEFVARMSMRADDLRVAVSALVRTANEHLSPAESRRNRRQRRSAQRQLAEYLHADADQPPEGRSGT